ncbi:unnamed protein product [Calicophoron daubneyi]
MNFQIGSFFHCAKNYETASIIYKDLKEFQKMADLVTKAGRLLRENGTPDTASYVYEKAAKSLEQTLPERAGEFYECSAEACEIEEKYHEAADQCNLAARVWVRLRKIPEAERALRHYIEYIQKGNPNTIGATLEGLADNSAVPKLSARAVIVLILLKLYKEDEVAAGKILNEAIERWRFNETEELRSVSCLLSAIDQGDGDGASQALKAPCFRTLDLDYVRLLKDIKLPKPSEKNEGKVSSSLAPFSGQPEMGSGPLAGGPITASPAGEHGNSGAEGRGQEEEEEEEHADIC